MITEIQARAKNSDDERGRLSIENPWTTSDIIEHFH